MFLDFRQQKIAPLGAFVRVAFQQALSTGKPAVRTPDLAAHEQAKAKPERTADGAKSFADIPISIVGALERLEVVIVPADKVCRERKQLQIPGLKRTFLIDLRERLERLRPGPPLIGYAGAIEVSSPCRSLMSVVHVPHLLVQATVVQKIGDQRAAQ